MQKKEMLLSTNLNNNHSYSYMFLYFSAVIQQWRMSGATIVKPKAVILGLRGCCYSVNTTNRIHAKQIIIVS